MLQPEVCIFFFRLSMSNALEVNLKREKKITPHAEFHVFT